MWDCVVKLIEDYQSLIAGILALVAAWVTVRAINQQTKTSEKLERERIKRAELSARSTLPLALSSICNYARLSLKLLVDCYHELEKPNSRLGLESIDSVLCKEVIPLPDSSIVHLKSFIENSTNKSIRLALAKLIQKIQIHNSRMGSLLNPVKLGENEGDLDDEPDEYLMMLVEYMLNIIIIDCLTSALFSYARFESEEVGELDWNRIHEYLISMEIKDDVSEKIQKMVDDRSKNKTLSQCLGL